MARAGEKARGAVKWYVPSIAALGVGLVAVIVVWVLIPPAQTVHVTPFDPNDDRIDITLRLDADATAYVVSGMADVKATVKVVDGKTVYQPVLVRGKVISVFREVEYEARFAGEWQLKETGAGGTMQTVRGLITGPAVVPWDVAGKPSADRALATDCKIVDEFPKGRFLVEGALTLIDKPLLVGPGARIENAHKDQRTIALTDAFGHKHTLLPGGKVKLDSAGEFIEEDVPDTTKKTGG